MPLPALTPRRPRDARVARLARRLPRLGLVGVLADLDRTGTPCDVPGTATRDGFAWAPRDADDPDWVPQGVAAPGDGDVLLVAWYGRRRLGRHPGSRVTVVDRSDPERPRYRHVRLVAPRPLGLLGRVPVHAGGLAVVDGLLHVADTRGGVRVFALDDVLLHRGQPVLPQRQRLRLSGARLRVSFLWAGDVDGERSLVVGEYGRKGSRPKLARWALGPDGLADGPAREVHEDAPLRMQGVAVVDGTWVVSASAGEGVAGDLHVGRPGAFVRHRGVLPTGPEDLDDDTTGRLWCATEWPGRRWVFSVDYPRS